MQLNIPNVELPYPTRPKFFSDEVASAAVEKLLPRVLQWIDPNMPPNDPEVAQVKLELLDSILWNDDEYEIAKHLDDRYSWNSNGDLVDILESAFFAKRDAYNDIVETWVITNGVEPRCVVGDNVEFTLHGKTHRGTITSIETKRAQYVIFSEEMGHKKQRDQRHVYTTQRLSCFAQKTTTRRKRAA